MPAMCRRNELNDSNAYGVIGDIKGFTAIIGFLGVAWMKQQKKREQKRPSWNLPYQSQSASSVLLHLLVPAEAFLSPFTTVCFQLATGGTWASGTLWGEEGLPQNPQPMNDRLSLLSLRSCVSVTPRIAKNLNSVIKKWWKHLHFGKLLNYH